MPMTSNAGKNIQHLMRTHPEMPHKQAVAAGLNAAREHGGGGKVKPKPKEHMKQKLRMKD